MSLVIGIIVGLVLGLTGAGGSVFAVPLLLFGLDLPATEAVGLSLGAVAFSTLFGVLLRIKSPQIQWLPALVYALIGSLFAPLGNLLGRYMNESWLMIGFSLLVFIVAYRLWRKATTEPAQSTVVRAELPTQETPSAAICRMNAGKPFQLGLPCVLGVSGGAIATGLLSGLFGVGGGFLIVPSLLFLTGISIRQAVATSLVVIAIISTSGFASYLMGAYHHHRDSYDQVLTLLPTLALGGVLGMVAGLLLSRFIAGPHLQKLFAVLMLIMAAVTLVSQLSQ